MRKIFPSIFLLFPIGLILLFFVSCGPAVFVEIETPTPSATFEVLATPNLDTPTSTCLWEDYPCLSDSLTLTAVMKPTLDAMLTASPVCSWPCPSDGLTMTAEMAPTMAVILTDTNNNSLTMTAVMGLKLDAMPSNTPPPGATIIPSVGDLGWGSVYGRIIDGVTNLPLEGAIVTCVHSSYTSPYPCNGVTTTNSDGIYAFTGVFFHDTDRITLIVDAPGYTSLRFEQDFFTRPEFHADLGLFPLTYGTFTPTPYLMCTAPACEGGILACGDPNGCLGGCGTVCLTKTPTP
jgi:hypothetical protein